MQKIITPFLLCTLLCLSFSSPIDPKKRNIPFALLSQYASSSGEVPLVLGDLGFTVHVDFSNYKDKVAAVKADASDYGNMAIALYTDETFFGTACEGFQSYCDKHPEVCQKTGAAGHSVFPYLETDSVSIQPEVYLDYNHWLLQSDAQLGTQCNQQYSVDAYGLLGMGFTDKSLPNFVGDTPSFAIHVAKNLSNGSFAFHSDMTKAKSETPAATLTTDNVWHVAKVDTVKIRGRSLDTTASMIFDLGSDSIGLPKDIFNHVLDAIAGSPSVGNCTIGDDFRPVCGYTGDIRRLSSLKIIIGDQTIDIPPEVYIVSTQNSTFYYDKIMLKIKKLSVDGSNDGLNVTKAYQNYIILGFPVLSYYYSVFQAGSAGQGTITLYYSGDYISASEMTWIFVVVGVAGILVIGICYFLYERKYRKDKELTQPLFDEAVKINAGRGKRVYDTKA